MDQRLQTIVDGAMEKFGLEEYWLETHGIYKRYDDKGVLFYVFNMEWLPRGAVVDDTLPEGSAIIEYIINKERYGSVIFVQGKSFSTKISFKEKTSEEVASWIEEETGLVLRLTEAYEDGFQFQVDVEGIRLSPDVVVEVKFDELGKLTYYVINDTALNLEDVVKSKFTLTLEEIEPIVKKQLQLVQFPSEVEKRFCSVYAMEEVYVTVDGTKIIPFFVHERTEVKVDEIFEWDKPLKMNLNREVLHLESRVRVELELDPDSVASMEEAFTNSIRAEHLQLSEEDVHCSRETTRDVLRTVFPEESGKWKMETIRREKYFIEVKCKVIEELSLFNRKLVVLIDPKTYNLLSYSDNSGLLDLFSTLSSAEKAVITHEEAFEKMIPYITLDPTYVYEFITGKYRLCGLLDAAEGIDAVTGEVVLLQDL